MDYQIKNIPITKLKQHEEICPIHLAEIAAQIKRDGFIADPIIVDKNTFVILDGHHRFNAAKKLGLKLIPACLVDYRDESIKVSCWRERETITKREVIEAGQTGRFLRAKTSRHLIPARPLGVNVALPDLK